MTGKRHGVSACILALTVIKSKASCRKGNAPGWQRNYWIKHVWNPERNWRKHQLRQQLCLKLAWCSGIISHHENAPGWQRNYWIKHVWHSILTCSPQYFEWLCDRYQVVEPEPVQRSKTFQHSTMNGFATWSRWLSLKLCANIQNRDIDGRSSEKLLANGRCPKRKMCHDFVVWSYARGPV